ncbi:MAG: FeoA family protein [Halanaerobium sp.]
MPLSMMKSGETGCIKKITGGRTARGKLTGLGLVCGKEVKIHSDNSGSGPIIIALGDDRIALGRGMAHKILVEKKGSEN